MCRLLTITVLVLTILSSASGQPVADRDKEKPGRASYSLTNPETAEQSFQQVMDSMRRWIPGNADLFRIGDTFFGASVAFRWPDKRVSLDVKDMSVPEIAASLQEQTGIEFIIGDGVPADLKITIHVTGMRMRDCLELLTSTTGLIYVPESRPAAEEPKSSEPDTKAPDAKKQQEPSSAGAIFFGKPQMVTHVTILNPRTEGIVVNMGKVSISLKNADPIDAVTNMIKQIKGASYVVMSVEDYLALQSPDDEARAKKALGKSSRPKVTIELRNVEVVDALAQLSTTGRFYITIPKPGVPNFLIIPDVTVTDVNALPSPPIVYWSTPAREAREQAICMEYTREMVDALLGYAKQNGGVLPEASNWINLIPIRNEYLERRVPGGRYQYSYGMNANLSGIKLSAIKKPSQTVLIFESDSSRGYGTEDDVIRNLRHPGGVVYGFADGSVKILTEKPNFRP